MNYAWLVLVVFALAFAFWVRRATDLFVLKVSRGGVRFVRGRIPPSLLRELKDVLRGAGHDGVVRVVHERGEARLIVDGTFDEGTQQRLRNVIGRYPLQRIRAGGRPR